MEYVLFKVFVYALLNSLTVNNLLTNKLSVYYICKASMNIVNKDMCLGVEVNFSNKISYVLK